MSHLAGKRILVVEDEALLGMVIEDAVLAAGGEIVGLAATVDDALKMVAKAADGDRIRGRRFVFRVRPGFVAGHAASRSSSCADVLPTGSRV